MALCKGAAITNLLEAVYVARCKDAATANFLEAVYVDRWKDIAIGTANFLEAVSVALCRDAANAKNPQMFMWLAVRTQLPQFSGNRFCGSL